MADVLSETTLTINTEEMKNVCNAYKEKVNALGVNEIDVTSDFSALISAGLFTTYFSSLKTSLEKVKTSVSTICSALQNFATSQEDIDEKYYTTPREDTPRDTGTPRDRSRTPSDNDDDDDSSSSDGKDKDGLKTEVDNESLEKLLNDKDFMNSLLSILTTSPSLLGDISKSDYLKELLLLKNVSNPAVKEILSQFTGEALRIALYKLITGEIKINSDNEDILNDIKKVVLDSLKSEGNTYTYSGLNGTWTVAKTTQDLNSYLSKVKSKGIYQASDTSKYGDSCLAFAEVYGANLKTGKVNSASQAGNYCCATSYTSWYNDSESETLKAVYNQIIKGNPVVIQVNGNKQGTSRHFVTVVGFKSSVKSAEELKATDLLIIDSWDGKLERMDTSSSRFLTTGKACHKNYSGYYLRVLKS